MAGLDTRGCLGGPPALGPEELVAALSGTRSNHSDMALVATSECSRL